MIDELYTSPYKTMKAKSSVFFSFPPPLLLDL